MPSILVFTASNSPLPSSCQCYETQEALVSCTLMGDLENVIIIFIKEKVQSKHGSIRSRDTPRVELSSYEESCPTTSACSTPVSAGSQGDAHQQPAPNDSLNQCRDRAWGYIHLRISRELLHRLICTLRKIPRAFS